MIPDGRPDIRLSDEEFRLITDLVHCYCGLSFTADSREFLERRLVKRLSGLNIRDFREYYRFLRYGRGHDQELAEIVDLLTTNETYFFREMYQFRALVEEIIPEIIGRDPEIAAGRALRIWSAGCSTGEEPFTVAMLILESECCRGCRVEIVATDISTRVLHHARRGVYGASAFRATEEYYRDKYFSREEDGYHLIDPVRDLVTFSHLNLLDDAMLALLGPMDIILCRNVIIYFDQETRRRVAETFARLLRDRGFLLLGHADSLMNITTVFTLRHFINDMVYQKPLTAGGAGPCVK